MSKENLNKEVEEINADGSKETFIVNKLVRDRVPFDAVGNDGIAFNYFTLNDFSFKNELIRKLIEESIEVKKAKSLTNLVEELVDVFDIYMKILEVYRISLSEIAKKSNEKKESRGGFNKKIFLKSMTISKDHKLFEKFSKSYRKNSDINKKNEKSKRTEKNIEG